MLVMMQGNWNRCALLVEMENDAATIENSMEKKYGFFSPQKTKHGNSSNTTQN